MGDRLLAVADRVAPIVAHESDARQCRIIIQREIQVALETLAESIDALPEIAEDWE